MVRAYRGGDLPLRTPRAVPGARDRVLDGQIMPPGPDWLVSAFEQMDDAPVLVDPTVLACCNQAYELAVAHRSADVCLEHLVHAMTLIPDAIRALHEAGVSDTSLRRESGIIIAHDIPSVANGQPVTPQTSEQMSDVLRYAAGMAYARRSPVTIEDLLATLFDMTRDQDTRSLLNRHRSEWSLREPIENAPRYINGTNGASSGSTHADFSTPPLNPANAQAGTEAKMDIPTVTDSYQNNRIDALERTVRELADALRAGSGQAPQPTPAPPVTYVDPQPRPHVRTGRIDDGTASEMLSRLNDVEITVEQKFRELARTWNVLGDRLQTLEDRIVDGDRNSGFDRKDLERVTESIDRLRTLETIPGRLDRIDNLVAKLDRLDRLDMVDTFDKKLGDLEQTFLRVVSRLEGLETRLDDKVDGDFDLDPIRQRLDAIGRQVAERPNLMSELAPLQQRLDVISRQVAERPAVESATVDLAPLSARLERLEQTINERSADGVDLGPVMDRMKEVESRIGDNSLLVETITGRMDTFDGNVDAVRAQMNQLSVEVGGVGRDINDRLNKISLGGGDIDPNLIVNAVSQPMQSTVGELRGLIETDRKEQRQQFEYLVQGLGKASQDHRNDLTEVHEAMLKLNGNQQTLAQSMDRWRLDVSGDLGVLASRLEQVETRFAVAPSENSSRIEQLAQQMQQVTTVLQRKEERRSGFLMWLFGTEDWWSDGWRTPEEREAAAAERSGFVTTVETNTFTRPEDRPLQG